MEENKNEEIIAYIKFYGEIKKVILSNTFDEFKLKLCKVLEINENLFNSLKLSYKDEDNDTISVSSEEDYNILIGQIKSKEVDIINIEKEGNANIDINACEKSILKFNEKLNKDEENEREEIKINNKNLNIISNQQFEINNEENNNKKYNNINKNEIIINNNIPNNKINNNLIIHNDNDLESPYIHYNNFNNNIQHNKNTINFNNLNYINNGNRNINLNNQTYMVFPYYCNLCNQYPIVKVLYYCLVCGIPLCQECEEKLGINHRHSILKVQTKQQYDDLQIKINGNSKEKVNIQNNNKDNSNQSGIQKIADNFTNTIKNSVLYLFGNDNKNENLNNIDNRGQIYNQPMIPQKMNLIQLARAKYDLDGISDNQLQEAIEKANGNIDDAIVLLMS